MKIPTKKLNNGFEIPVFGIGTWLIGGSKVRDDQNDDTAQIESIKTAVDIGLTHIDTAENYAAGWAEKLTGIAIKNYPRNKLFLASKVDKTHLRYNDLITSARATLKRLQTDYLDLYLIHSPNDDIPLEETMRAMDDLLKQGLIKNIGVSNFKTKRLKQTQQYTKNKIVVNQVYYNLMMREPEVDGLLNYCQNNDILLEAYRPLEKGSLLENVPALVGDLSKKYKKTPAQIALNWLLSQKNVVTISKITKRQHIEENIGAVGWEMEKEDIEKLRNEFPGQIGRPEGLPLI